MIEELAPHIVPVVLANITTAYPYHDSHLAFAGEPPHDPFAAHPAFGNSFDWHSSAHSHWTAIQLIEHAASKCGETPEAIGTLEEAVAANLQRTHVDAEIAYLRRRAAYERPYGWAWAMVLAAAAERSTRSLVAQRGPGLRALAECIAATAMRWLDVLPLPVRHGVHSNTAFSLGLMFDASQTLGFTDLSATIADRARAWFSQDRDWPAHFERSGNDFLSPGLAEADLMRRALAVNEFATWWSTFLPSLSARSAILSAVTIPDVDDGHIVHLHGLNLSRAGALARIAAALEDVELLDACATALRRERRARDIRILQRNALAPDVCLGCGEQYRRGSPVTRFRRYDAMNSVYQSAVSCSRTNVCGSLS